MLVYMYTVFFKYSI